MTNHSPRSSVCRPRPPASSLGLLSAMSKDDIPASVWRWGRVAGLALAEEYFRQHGALCFHGVELGSA
jgi:hypothetical protein